MNSTNNPCTIQIQHDEYMEYIMRCAHEAGFREVSMGFGSSKVFHSDGWEAEIERITICSQSTTSGAYRRICRTTIR